MLSNIDQPKTYLMPHFFISYAKKDTRELALALSDALSQLPNTTAWVDRSLRAGHSWETQIQAEIFRCDYMIVLYSPDLNRHLHGQEESYVLTEIAYAKYTLKKQIIPVMAQTTQPPLSLTTAHYIDFTLPGVTLRELVEAIAEETGVSVANEQPSPVSSGATVSQPTTLPQQSDSVEAQPQPIAPKTPLYDVVMTELGPKKINVIKAVRAHLASGLKDTKEMVEAATPAMMIERSTQAVANQLQADMQAAGATVLVVPTGSYAVKSATHPNLRSFQVRLMKVGNQKVSVIKLVREFTHLGLAEAKNLVVSGAPILINGVSLSTARDFLQELEAVGAEGGLWPSSALLKE